MSSEKHLVSKAFLISIAILVLLSGGSHAETHMYAMPMEIEDSEDPLLKCLDTIDVRYKIAIREVTQVEENFKALLGKENP